MPKATIKKVTQGTITYQGEMCGEPPFPYGYCKMRDGADCTWYNEALESFYDPETGYRTKRCPQCLTNTPVQP